MNGYQWQSIRGKTNSRLVFIMRSMGYTSYTAQSRSFDPKDRRSKRLLNHHHRVLSCETCGGLHNHQDCPHTIPHAEHANYVGNQGEITQVILTKNTYNPGWRQHPNFGWGNQGQPRPNPNPDLHTSPGSQPNQGKPNLEDDFRKATSFSHEHDYANAAMQKYVEDDMPKENLMKKEVAEYKPKIPYQSLTEEDRREDKFGKNLNSFKKLHANIPFVDPPSKHVRDLNDIIPSENKLNKLSNVQLNDKCPSNELPQKFNDPGSFIIPCTIDGLPVDRALADLGASINVMSYETFKHAELSELKPIRMDIQLADKSIKHPRGIVKDVLVKIDKFIFPVDFIILDMHDDIEVPLILGRPFLATAKSLIDVHDGKLTLRVGVNKLSLKFI
ncbi:hypothetical protein DH2020_016553 [Rehmannia glutinosa]|uniref:Uncharacterized protein n=1 Tax=Rehmannia glutinosa TaxID=99300 RepID=A0ABR0WQ51_REHGL